MHRSPALALAALLLPAGLAACGDGGGSGIASGDGFSVEAALAELPVPPGDDSPGYTVVAFDLAGAAEANGAGDPPDDPEEVGRWFIDASGAVPDDDDVLPPVFVPAARVLGVETGLSSEDLREQLGFGLADVEGVAEVVDHGPFRFSVVTGDVGEGSLAEAGLEPGDDGVARADDDAHVAADGDRLAVGTDDDAVAGWAEGDGETLADDEATAAVAAALDGTDAVSALLTSFVPRSAGYEAVGIGWSVDDGEPRQAIAYAFPDEEAAEDAVSRIEDAFSVGSMPEQIVLDDVEVDGTVVLARVRPGPEGRPQGPYIALQQALPIFTLAEG